MDRVVIVGAGVFGAALARELAGRGTAVTLVDSHQPGHARAASGDETRLIRSAHGEDDWYAASARRAIGLWEELDPRLVIRCGMAWLARREDGWEAASERVLRGLGIPVERVTPEDAARTLLPGLRTDPFRFVLHEPEAGVLRAREATRTLVD